MEVDGWIVVILLMTFFPSYVKCMGEMNSMNIQPEIGSTLTRKEREVVGVHVSIHTPPLPPPPLPTSTCPGTATHSYTSVNHPKL